MRAPRHRAWRFDHPASPARPASGDAAPRGEASRAGLSIAPTGGVAMVEGEAAVRQAILLLLSTRPGERVMRPGYGCDLGKLVFSPNDDTAAGLAIHYVRRALETWEPRVEVLGLEAGRGDDRPEELRIGLEYRVRATRAIDRIQLTLDLAGEASR